MNNTTAVDAITAFDHANQELKDKRRMANIIGITIFSLVLIVSIYVGEVRINKFIEGLPGLSSYFKDTMPDIHAKTVVADVKEWYWGINNWLSLLLDTVLIAFLATLIGATGAFLICFPASRNLMNNSWIYFISRRFMEFARSVPELVYAMIFVFAFGLGPFPGVIAISIHSIGALGKLFSEVNENVDMNHVEGVRAAGANWFQTIRYAVVPQVIPNFLSYTLLRFEINVRAASVIGFVGAGGIGQELMFVIRQFVYQDISAIVLLIIGTVSIIDISCEKLRHHVIGDEALL